MSGRGPEQKKPVVRCAVYTRKSSEEGLALEFNSLDAQREAAEAFVTAQRHEGWRCNPDRYDDGGFSGGNMDRPALAQLLKDIDAGKVDCVVVYKVDRLSRSLLDFARIMETFDKGGVSFVSVTQQFNTTHSMGRLTLNVLLSFAQFEREIIGERIRDKIAAQRRRGKWTGGVPVLGYDVDRSGPSPKLVINAAEAARARQIFDLYLQHGSLLKVVAELRRRGWQTRTRVTKAGRALGGEPFDKCKLHALLTNPLYIGQIRHKDRVYAGEHAAIIDAKVFAKVQAMLKGNGRSGGLASRNRYGALLKGLLRCTACDRAMSHTFTTKGGRQYRYYACTHAVKAGRAACPTPSLPAAEVERVVVDQIRGIGKDARLLRDVLAEARKGVEAELKALETEQGDLTRELARHHATIKRLVTEASAGARLADLNERVSKGEGRLAELATAIEKLQGERVSEADVRAAFADFDNVWRNLTPREQAQVLGLLVARVDYDPKVGTVAVTFHRTGIKALAGQHNEPEPEEAAA